MTSQPVRLDLDELLQRLRDWRRLPGYRLEPRLDAILAPYIPRLFAEPGADTSDWYIIPEFPVPLAIAKPEVVEPGHRTVHVDFLIVSPDGAPRLVELKTDDSDDAQQVRYLQRLAGRTVEELVTALAPVRAKSRSPEKYDHLMECLRRPGMPGRGRGTERKVEVIYLAPRRVIDRLTSGAAVALSSHITFHSLARLAQLLPQDSALRGLLADCDPPT